MKTLASDRICAVIFAATFWSGNVLADGYFAYSTSVAYIYDNDAGVEIQPWTGVIHDGYQIDSAVYNTSAATNNPGGNLNNRFAYSNAAADLSSGTLGAMGGVADFADPVDPSIYVAGAGIAEFGDSFTTTTQNGPFVWSASDTVTFSMLLTGVHGDFSDVSAFPWQVSLAILKPGSIGPGYSDAEDVLVDVGWKENRTSAGVSTIYDDTFRPNLIPISFSHAGSLESGGVLLNASFNPGGDFDWVIRLQAGAFFFPGTGQQYTDLSHTLTVNYEGLTGTITQSGSGVFPTTIPVPEPETYAMMLAGLGLVGWIARRRKQFC